MLIAPTDLTDDTDKRIFDKTIIDNARNTILFGLEERHVARQPYTK